MLSQVVSGKIYDSEETVKGVLIINKTQKDTTYSDPQGNFKIKGIINDSIFFNSLFHHSKTIIVKQKHLDETTVLELFKITNVLDEVLLSEKENKLIDYGYITGSMMIGIKINMKNNPHLYMPKSSYSKGINFGELAKLIGLKKLFKKKNIKNTIKYNQIDSLFDCSKLFNNKLLSNHLKINKEYKCLFFEYCEAQKLGANLLSEKNNLIFLDSLYKCSIDFLKIISSKEQLDTSSFKK